MGSSTRSIRSWLAQGFKVYGYCRTQRGTYRWRRIYAISEIGDIRVGRVNYRTWVAFIDVEKRSWDTSTRVNGGNA